MEGHGGSMLMSNCCRQAVRSQGRAGQEDPVGLGLMVDVPGKAQGVPGWPAGLFAACHPTPTNRTHQRPFHQVPPTHLVQQPHDLGSVHWGASSQGNDHIGLEILRQPGELGQADRWAGRQVGGWSAATGKAQSVQARLGTASTASTASTRCSSRAGCKQPAVQLQIKRL
jgi:hypothetical protein